MKRVFVSLMLVATSMLFVGTALAADGADLYKSRCAMCHGADGQGSIMGNAFTGNRFISSGTDEAITAVILKGRNGADKKFSQFAMGMPAQKLTDAEVSAIITHLKALASK